MQVEAWLVRAARLAPNTTALEAPSGRLSYAQLLSVAMGAAAELERRGAREGERVAIALPPGIDFAIALHACFLLGAVAVPVDLRLTAEERERVGATADVHVTEPLALAWGAPPDASSADLVSQASDAASPPLASGAEPGRAPIHDLDAVCAVIHTSGTTSAPRPIELTYGNFLWSALGSAVALGLNEDERWLCTLPVSHVGGLSILVRSAIYATTAAVHERFEVERVLQALRSQRITLVSLVSTTLSRLLDAGLEHPASLRWALTGGGPVPAALVRRAAQAGVAIAPTYGLTEACSQVTTNGPPLFCTRVRIAPTTAAAGGEHDPVGAANPVGAAGMDGQHDPVGAANPVGAAEASGERQAGEILVSGPTVAPGSLARDGRLHTGDLGWIDESGFLHVSGRASDTIVSGGENVAPAEVEAALEEHPAVLEAAVLGREDPQWGEAVTAVVVLAAGADAGEAELRAHCAARLAPFKVPKRVLFVTAPLPRTRSGKLLRRELQGIF